MGDIILTGPDSLSAVLYRQQDMGPCPRGEPSNAEFHAWALRAEALEARLDDDKREIKTLTEVCHDSNAVCVCGCPASEHEMVGPDDGEQCEHEDHECIRTSRSVAKIVANLRDNVNGLIYDTD